MEEKKAKTVEMKRQKTAGGKEQENEKLTYEQLNNVCQQLVQQNQQLNMKVRQLEDFTMFKRLDYLFKVVELSSVFKDAEFTNSCIDEIKAALTPVEEPEEEKKTPDGGK